MCPHCPAPVQPAAWAAGWWPFFGAPLVMGIESVLDVTGFDEKLMGADLVFTGEGRLDTQSLRGKVVIGVARRAKRQGVKVVTFVGDIGDAIEAVYAEGITAVFSINRRAIPFEEAKKSSRQDMKARVDNFLRFWREIRSV